MQDHTFNTLAITHLTLCFVPHKTPFTVQITSCFSAIIFFMHSTNYKNRDSINYLVGHLYDKKIARGTNVKKRKEPCKCLKNAF